MIPSDSGHAPVVISKQAITVVPAKPVVVSKQAAVQVALTKPTVVQPPIPIGATPTLNYTPPIKPTDHTRPLKKKDTAGGSQPPNVESTKGGGTVTWNAATPIRQSNNGNNGQQGPLWFDPSKGDLAGPAKALGGIHGVIKGAGTIITALGAWTGNPLLVVGGASIILVDQIALSTPGGVGGMVIQGAAGLGNGVRDQFKDRFGITLPAINVSADIQNAITKLILGR